MTTDIGALLDQAYQQGYALGRKEAGEEIAVALKARDSIEWVLSGSYSGIDAAEIAQQVASQPPETTSNGLTASSRHPGTPEDTKPPQEGS